MTPWTTSCLVAFDRIKSGEMRFGIGAVNVRTGKLVAQRDTDDPEHR
jgi:hypothetical protein